MSEKDSKSQCAHVEKNQNATADGGAMSGEAQTGPYLPLIANLSFPVVNAANGLGKHLEFRLFICRIVSAF